MNLQETLSKGYNNFQTFYTSLKNIEYVGKKLDDLILSAKYYNTVMSDIGGGDLRRKTWCTSL